jgi:hypothetical protein
VKGSEVVEMEEEEVRGGWDGDVVGDEVMEGLLARMVRGSEESEEALWADLFNGVDGVTETWSGEVVVMFNLPQCQIGALERTDGMRQRRRRVRQLDLA